MDLISAIVLTMSDKVTDLLASNNNTLEGLLIEFLREDISTVRQYVFGLFGDIYRWISDIDGNLI